MPVIELESASLHEDRYMSDSSQRGVIATSRTSSGTSEFSSTKGHVQGIGGATNRSLHIKKDATSTGGQSVVKTAFTQFTESLSASSDEFQDGVQKTFSSIVNSFSRDQSTSSSSESGYEGSENSSRYHSAGGSRNNPKGNNLRWSEFVLPDSLRSRVSSLTSRDSSSSGSSSHWNATNSSLSSKSDSPRMNNKNVQITVDGSGFVLRESTDDSSSSSSSPSSSDTTSENSWHDTASRDVSLLDTIGEGESGEEEEGDSSSEGGSEGDGDIRRLSGQANGVLYDYEDDGDDSTAFDSDIGLEDLGEVMMQIGSCHFEPESISQSFDDDYSYTSDMFPPVISSFMGGTNNNKNTNEHQYEGFPYNPIFQKRKQQKNHQQQHKNDQSQPQSTLTSIFVSVDLHIAIAAFSFQSTPRPLISSFFLSLLFHCICRTRHSAAAVTFD